MMYSKMDYHIHSNFSKDASKEATFEAYIKAAKEKKIEKIAFTDHVDFDAVHPLFKENIDYDEYMRAFNQIKEDKDISVALGVEIGYQSHTIQQNKHFLKKYPFEFVILSIHYLEKKDLYTGEYFQGKTKEEAYNIYFDTCLEAIENMDQFTVFGHLDYISRYSPFGDVVYSEFKEKIDVILRALINKNKGIEINTSGYRYEGRTYPSQEVINRYKELGGTIITYGSDAHCVEELGVRRKEY